MNKNKIVLIALICISLTSILVLSVPSFVDYYITQSAPTKLKDCFYSNCIIQGTYNKSSINIELGNIQLDRQFQSEWLYKECQHSIGDDVKYFGQFYNGSFILRRELC